MMCAVWTASSTLAAWAARLMVSGAVVSRSPLSMSVVAPGQTVMSALSRSWLGRSRTLACRWFAPAGLTSALGMCVALAMLFLSLLRLVVLIWAVRDATNDGLEPAARPLFGTVVSTRISLILCRACDSRNQLSPP